MARRLLELLPAIPLLLVGMLPFDMLTTAAWVLAAAFAVRAAIGLARAPAGDRRRHALLVGAFAIAVGWRLTSAHLAGAAAQRAAEAAQARCQADGTCPTELDGWRPRRSALVRTAGLPLGYEVHYRVADDRRTFDVRIAYSIDSMEAWHGGVTEPLSYARDER